VLATGFPYRRGELEHSNLENFGRFFYDIRGVRRMGSAAIDLAFVAAGRLDGYWELHLSPHDVAAGTLLVREAGGLVTDARGGDDWLRGGSIVAAGPGVHEAIRERVVC
jgi:myo-inositol-1(or 4)-monophosphatase